MAKLWDELSTLDRPEILQFVFYPRKDFAEEPRAPNAVACSIPVDDGVSISCRFFAGNDKYPNILFFHGNGEIARDYDDIGSIYNRMGLNFFVADYRGYGMSGGKPTLTNMIKDAHPIFEGFKQVLKEKAFSGNLFIMGRSLGSASAIELAYHYQSQLKGLIVESGFANMFNLFEYFRFPAEVVGVAGKEAPTSLQLIRKISIPTLVMHGEHDQIVPVQEGKSLYDNIAAEDKRLLIIPGVDHNTIFLGGMEQYLQTLRDFVLAHS
jgi:alpha-beta hydrolase superfamily lysophospholipase